MQLTRVHGPSMEPTISQNSWVIEHKAGRRKNFPERFDVVRIENPVDAGHWIVKRVVGLPGEEVELANGALKVDGVRVDEEHAYRPDSDRTHSWWPNAEEYVVLGDNRAHSTDSRNFGVISRSLIRARVRI